MKVADFDVLVTQGRPADGWTSRSFYFERGAAVYVLGFGNFDIENDRAVIDSIVGSFTLT